MMLVVSKALAMEQILLEDIPKGNKVINASQQLSGLELNKLNAVARKNIEKELIFLNSILTQYPIKTFDDYHQITPKHLEQMIQALSRICQILKRSNAD